MSTATKPRTVKHPPTAHRRRTVLTDNATTLTDTLQSDGIVIIGKQDDEILVNMPVRLLQESPENSRERFEGIDDLARSIKQNGLLQRPRARLNDEGKYELISGARRLRAVKLLKQPAEGGQRGGSWQPAASRGG